MANVSIRMDDNLKKQAEDLFNDLGMNLTTAFTIFVKQAIREQFLILPDSKSLSDIFPDNTKSLPQKEENDDRFKIFKRESGSCKTEH